MALAPYLPRSHKFSSRAAQERQNGKMRDIQESKEEEKVGSEFSGGAKKALTWKSDVPPTYSHISTTRVYKKEAVVQRYAVRRKGAQLGTRSEAVTKEGPVVAFLTAAARN